MSNDDLCSDCGRPYYDYLDADEMQKVDEAEAHDQYCCNEKGYPDPLCLETKINRLQAIATSAEKLIELTFPKCEVKDCKEFATSGLNGYTCDQHGSEALQEHVLDENQKGKRYDMNYAEALREYLTAREKNGI